jgi:hypothetical protein
VVGSLIGTKSRLLGVDTVLVLLFNSFSRTSPWTLRIAKTLIRSVQTIELSFGSPELYTQISCVLAIIITLVMSSDH